MSRPTVRTIADYIDAFAPFETAESYDNVGILAGDESREVSRILCSLDVTTDTVREAVDLGAELIVSHHPLMFHGVRRLVSGVPEADVLRALIKADLSLISAHTNWDQTALSGSACVARAIGLEELTQSGYLFTGAFARPRSAAQIAADLQAAIRAPLRVYGRADQQISVMSFAGGAFGEGYLEALAAGAQAYLTGEIRHHEITDAVARDIVIFDAGHYASEAPMIPALCGFLRDRLAADRMDCQVTETTRVPFPGALELGGGHS